MSVSNNSADQTRPYSSLNQSKTLGDSRKRERNRSPLRSVIHRVNAENKLLQQQLKQVKDQYRVACSLWSQERLKLADRPPSLFDHPIANSRPLSGHQYCVELIAHSIELAKRVGFRAAADAMSIIFKLLGLDLKVPSHDAIEQWTLRLGVASLQNTFTKDDRVLWMADHSSQIGKEKVLLIIGVALKDLPPPGQTLNFDSIKVLAIVPGQSWKKEDVEREYMKLSEQIGSPVFLLCDGAIELREPAEKLVKDGKKTIVLGDLKHQAANLLEKEIGRSLRFKKFISEVGLTRNRVQQTELGHFAPPPLKQKSRFMNLGSLLEWSSMVIHHLNDPMGSSREGISEARLEEKLGWLRAYSDEIVQWKKCQEVINRTLYYINCHGLDHQSARMVEANLNIENPGWNSKNCASARIGKKLIAWIENAARLLDEGERAWLSTEILESLFGRFKQLERQHSKGGYTRLIAAIPTLCTKINGKIVRRGFMQVKSDDLRTWLKATLGATLTSRRNIAYREYRQEPVAQP